MKGFPFHVLIEQIKGDRLERLDLNDPDIGPELIGDLVKELKGNKSVKVVSMIGCGLGPSFAAGVLSDVLKVNTSVTTLDLTYNNFVSEGARAIAEVLKANQCVKKLCLGWNRIGLEGARAVGGMLSVNKTLKELYLGVNEIGSEEARAVAEGLKANQSVEMLELSNNNIGTEGAQAIGEALKVNYFMKELYLQYNNFGAEGTRALLDALQVHGSLTRCIIDEFQDELNALCQRNVSMHSRARESVVSLLSLRRMRRITWIPKEMMVMIGQMLWRTKSDVKAWSFVEKKKRMKRARRNGSCDTCDASMKKCFFHELNVPEDHEEKCDVSVCSGKCSLVPIMIATYLNIHNEETWRLCASHMREVKRLYARDLAALLKEDSFLKENLENQLK